MATEGDDRPRAPADRAAWRALAREIEACRRCPLGAVRTHVVVYRGSLRPTVVFVGEAPGRDEDLAGVPFVGRAGRRLDAAIARIGLAPGEFGVLNLLKCRPPANRFDRAAARACRPYLDRQLAWLGPRLLVTLGAHALRALDPTAPPVTKAAGRVRPGTAPAVFPLLHPAAALRSRRYATRWELDVGRLGAYLRGGAQGP
ncbi:MAG TPA: uracil-DNA glycosylase [Thermoplasmata archaeon]|nr:uracil-DNA glycosylase [Thermoplasmata archaeon]